MKRFVTLLAALALVLGMAVSAMAEVVVKADGDFVVNANIFDNRDFQATEDGGDSEDDFTIWERARIRLSFVANESVNGAVRVLYGSPNNDSGGTWNWGALGFGGEAAVSVDRAYVGFRWPNTDVLIQAGQQDVTLPHSGYFGNPILSNNAASLLVTMPFNEMIGLTLGYFRYADTTSGNDFDEADAFFAALPINAEAISVTPFVAYSLIGEDVAGFPTDADETQATAYWLGAGFSGNFEPIVVYADAYYGMYDGGGDVETSGFFVDAAVEFTGLDVFVPSAFVWYSTGNDNKAEDEMPTLSEDWYVGTTAFGGTGLRKSDRNLDHIGTMGFGVKLDKISFVEKLTHTLVLGYAMGTKDGADFAPAFPQDGLTDDDAVLFVDFNHKYMIYENLAAIAELGYMAADMDDNDDTSDFLKAAIGLKYSF